jgi:hypothetical protein
MSMHNQQAQKQKLLLLIENTCGHPHKETMRSTSTTQTKRRLNTTLQVGGDNRAAWATATATSKSLP